MEHKDAKYMEWLQNEVNDLFTVLDNHKTYMADIINHIRPEVEQKMEEIGKLHGLTGTQVKLLYSFYIVTRFQKVTELSKEMPGLPQLASGFNEQMAKNSNLIIKEDKTDG